MLLQAKLCTKRSCAIATVLALVFGTLAVAAVQIYLLYVSAGTQTRSAGEWLTTRLWFLFRIIIPPAVLAVNVALIVDTYRARKGASVDPAAAVEDQPGEPANPPTSTVVPATLVPTTVVVAVALVSVAVEALATVAYAVLYFVLYEEWCERRSMPALGAVGAVYAVLYHVGNLIHGLRFLIYVVAVRQFRAALRHACVCRLLRALRNAYQACCVKPAVNYAAQEIALE